MLRNGDKRRSHPLVLVLIEARRRLLTPRTNMHPKGNKFQRRQVGLCETVPGASSAVGRFHRALAGIFGRSRAPCKVVNRHIPAVKAAAQRVTVKAIRRSK